LSYFQDFSPGQKNIGIFRYKRKLQSLVYHLFAALPLLKKQPFYKKDCKSRKIKNNIKDFF